MTTLRVLLSSLLLGATWISAQSSGQTSSPPVASHDNGPTLRVTARSVMLDVIDTSNGKPVAGLKKDAFTVIESGKVQAVSFFEENVPTPSAPLVQIPKMLTDVFTNCSPYPDRLR